MSLRPKIGDIVVIDWAGRVQEVEVYDDRPDSSRIMVWVDAPDGSGGVLYRSLYNVPRDTILEIKAA